jgi:hypothetical protein
MTRPLSTVAEVPGLERNIITVSAAIFCPALGENLFLGAPITAIGFFGTCEDFLNAVQGSSAHRQSWRSSAWSRRSRTARRARRLR